MPDGYYDSNKIYQLSTTFDYGGPIDNFQMSACGWIYPYRLNKGQNIIELKNAKQGSLATAKIQRKYKKNVYDLIYCLIHIFSFLRLLKDDTFWSNMPTYI